VVTIQNYIVSGMEFDWSLIGEGLEKDGIMGKVTIGELVLWCKGITGLL
jgi:hypothetical protein